LQPPTSQPPKSSAPPTWPACNGSTNNPGCRGLATRADLIAGRQARLASLVETVLGANGN
jgi:hypothetical protein